MSRFVLTGVVLAAALVGCGGGATVTEMPSPSSSVTDLPTATATATGPIPSAPADSPSLVVPDFGEIAVTAAREVRLGNRTPPAGRRLVLVYVELTAEEPLSVTPRTFALVDGTRASYEPIPDGVNPAFELTTEVAPGATNEGYLTFEIPFGGAYRLSVSGADGEPIARLAIAIETAR